MRSTAVRTSRSLSSQLAASAMHELGAPALLGDQLDRRAPALARLLAHVADDHVRALPREGDRDRPPDAGGAAGDDRRPALRARPPSAQLSSPFARPPSISSVMPEMYAARVEQRNVIASAISPGSPKRRAGIRPSSVAREPAGSSPLA